MSQRAVESILGRLITDVEFRARFFSNARNAGADGDLVLTAREQAALLSIDVSSLHSLGVRLDPTIVRGASLAEGSRADDQTAFAFERRPIASATRAGRR